MSYRNFSTAPRCQEGSERVRRLAVCLNCDRIASCFWASSITLSVLVACASSVYSRILRIFATLLKKDTLYYVQSDGWSLPCSAKRQGITYLT